MELANETALTRFGQKRRDAAKWLRTWADVVRNAEWQNILDVRSDFRHADGVRLKSGVVITVFNVKGNEYRLLTTINYETRWVRVIDILTHEQYSRSNWKG